MVILKEKLHRKKMFLFVFFCEMAKLTLKPHMKSIFGFHMGLTTRYLLQSERWP